MNEKSEWYDIVKHASQLMIMQSSCIVAKRCTRLSTIIMLYYARLAARNTMI